MNELDSAEKAKRKYFKSKKGKKAQRKYLKTEAGKAAQGRYVQSDKGKAAQLRYQLSEKGQQTRERRKQKCQLVKSLSGFLKSNPGSTPQDFLNQLKEEPTIPTFCSICYRLNGEHDEGCPRYIKEEQ